MKLQIQLEVVIDFDSCERCYDLPIEADVTSDPIRQEYVISNQMVVHPDVSWGDLQERDQLSAEALLMDEYERQVSLFKSGHRDLLEEIRQELELVNKHLASGIVDLEAAYDLSAALTDFRYANESGLKLVQGGKRAAS
jgi:hypothetical protein